MRGFSWNIIAVSAAAILAGHLAAARPVGGDPLPTDKADRYRDRIDMVGGTGDGYTLSQIRWGDHRSFERVVLEFIAPEWEERSREVPRILLATREYPSRLVIRIPGATGIRDPVFSSETPLAKSRMLSGMTVLEPCGGDQSLILMPARALQYDVFTLLSPPRLVIDVRLSRGIPAEDEKFSLRTLPLFEEQQCLFLEATHESGVSGVLLTDVSGQVFGEVGLFDGYQEAWNMRDELSALNSRFSLVIKRRGIMETPTALP
ncbi:MAG: hypothetical protein JSV26_04295 [bacterium]|nr:MAG: hypothetical protein JSV26_04295 [bacterium]